MSVLFCHSMTGTVKLKPLVVGKSHEPHAFRNMHSSFRLPVQSKSMDDVCDPRGMVDMGGQNHEEQGKVHHVYLGQLLSPFQSA